MKAIVGLFCFGCVISAQPNTQNHVIVVSLDGFSASALQNPQIPLPNLRKMMAEGAYASAMRPINPTVTWPNHTAMVTGVDASIHSVLYNGLPVRHGNEMKIDPWVEKSELVKAPTVYDLAYRAGLTTAEIDWVAIAKPGTISWAFSEVPDPAGAVPKEMVAGRLVTASQVADFRKLPITERDEIWLQAALHILKTHKPNLMLLHFLTTDSVQHRYAPGTLAAETALALADQHVGKILDAVRDAGLARSTTVIIVSDHGFKSVRKSIHVPAALRQMGMTQDVVVVPEGGTAMIYILDAGKRAALLPRLTQGFGKIEGIARVVEPREFPEYGYPDPQTNKGMADLVAAAADGYAFDSAAQDNIVTDTTPPTGAHGYLNTDPGMNAIFVAWGAHIRAGSVLPQIRNVDVAPTIAQLLGLKMTGTAGQPLTQIIQ